MSDVAHASRNLIMKLSLDYLESQVLSTEYAYHGTYTVAVITTKAGIKLTGTSGCLDPANYDRAIGERIARTNAVSQLWALEGYFFAKLGLSEVDADPEQLSGFLEGKTNWASGGLVGKPAGEATDE